MIPTCPHFEADSVTESPLEGQAVIANLYPGLYEVVARPAADRIARGEEWLQTNTLDGTPAHEAFIKPDEPSYFQEFGPGGIHVAIGFANGEIINARRPPADGTGLCDPPNVQGGVNVGRRLDCAVIRCMAESPARMSRTPDQRIYSSGDYTAYGFAQCYVSMSQPDAADFAFAKCDPDGNFQLEMYRPATTSSPSSTSIRPAARRPGLRSTSAPVGRLEVTPADSCSPSRSGGRTVHAHLPRPERHGVSQP
jgi:hypothetical protein